MEPKELKEMQAETASWIHKLQSMQAENVMIKHRLAKAVSNQITKDKLYTVESFYDFFLQQDRILSLYDHDVRRHNLMLNKKCFDTKSCGCLVLKQQERIRCEINLVEKVFYKKKWNFQQLLKSLC